MLSCGSLYGARASTGAWLILLFLTPLVSSQAPTKVFQDPGFASLGWQQLPVITRGGGGSSTITRQTTGGNSGGFFQVDMMVNDGTRANPSSVANVFINSNAAYRPAIDGPITSLDYSEDDITFGNASQSESTGPAVRQNGKLYVLPNFSASMAKSWATQTKSGIRASDFSQLNASAYSLDNGSHPDFSASGAPMEFGFWRAGEQTTVNSAPCMYPEYGCPGGGPLAISQGIANWRVSLNQGSQVMTQGNTPNAGQASDPISTATGEYFEESTELSLGGPLPLRFSRYYSSFLRQSGAFGTLGNNWMHTFDAALQVNGSEAVALLFRGKRVRFNQSAGAWALTSPEQLTYQLASAANGFELLDPAASLTYTFSTAGALQSIADRNGNTLTISRAASSPGPDQVADGLGRFLRFTYAGGKLVRVQDQSGRSVSFSFTGDDLTSVTGPDGKMTLYSYASSGLIASKTLPAGNTILMNTYDAQARVVKQSDARGLVTTIDYDKPAAGKTTVTNALALAFQHAHQGDDNLIAYTDPAGQTANVTYDAANRPTSLTDRLADKSSITYNGSSGRVASYTDAQGNTTRYSYQSQTQGVFTFYNLSRIDYADGTFATFTYDASGNRLTAIDQAAKKTAYTYNSRGQLLTSTNAGGGVITFAYNSDGTLALRTTPAGDKTTYSYDDKKRLVRVTNADGSTLAYSYDDRDNLLSTTDARGKTRAFAYDDNGQIKSLSDASGRAVTVVYGTDQRPSSVASSGNSPAAFAFDDAGRIKTLTAPTGESVRFGFDSLNRLSSLADCSNKGIGFSYDREAVLSGILDGAGSQWSFSTDKAGRILQIISPLSRKFGFTYDKAGRLVSLTNPLTQQTSYTRDARGLLTSAALPGGAAAAYQRNDLGKITAITDPDGNVWQRSYDAQGRRISATDPLGQVTSYAYDARNRVSKITMPQGNVAIAYDAAGNLTRRLYSDGLDLSFTFNDNDFAIGGNGVSLDYNIRGDITSSNGIAISRDASFRISQIAYAPGLTVNYTYDCRGLLTQIADWLGGVTQLGYDDARRLVTITRPNGVATQYSYDLDSRLVGITENGATALSRISLKRDDAGRITSADRNAPLLPNPAGGVVQFGYDAASQLTGGSYDMMGRPLSIGARNYAWDLASRLTSYSGPDGSASFTYDAYGMRISRTGADGVVRNYALNYALPIPAISVIRDGSQNDLRYYVWLPDGILLYSIEASDSTRRFFHFDEMGSTLFLTDDSGAITDAYGVSPYGEQVDHSGPSDNPLTFLGAGGVMQEGSTGLFYMGFRYYDSASGRFLSRDPQPGLDPRALNPYQYAFGNPLLFSDPLAQGIRAGRRGNHGEGQFGHFILGLPYLPNGLRGPNETVAPRLAGAILEFLHGRERMKETDRE